MRSSYQDKVSRRPGLEAPHIELPFARPQPPSLSSILGLLSEQLRDCLGKKVQCGLTVVRNKSIDVHQMVQSMQRMFGNAGDDHACIAVPHKSHILKILPRQQTNDVLDVSP